MLWTMLIFIFAGLAIYGSVKHGQTVRNRPTFSIDVSTAYSINGEIERQRKRGYELVSQSTKTLGGHTLVFQRKTT